MTRNICLSYLTCVGLIASTFSAADAADAVRYDCERLGKTIGSPVTEMTAAADEGWRHAPDEARLVCTWFTQPAAKVVEGQPLVTEEWSDVGALSVQVVVSDEPLTQDAAAMINIAHELPPELAGQFEGAWIMSLKNPVYSELLDILAPQVIYDDLAVSVAYGNGFASPKNTGSALTVGWSVETALKILKEVAALR